MMPEMTVDASGGSKPVPDPTTLTTEQLIREISRLEESVKLRAEAAQAKLEGQINLTQERFEALRRALDERYATQQFAISIATTAAEAAKGDAKELFDSKLESMLDMLNERYATQTKALDAAFLAQQAAVATSFDASEKAVAAAMLAAKEAVEKANQASEKRFEGVNEFRAQLSDIINTMMPRSETVAMIKPLEDRITEMKSTIDRGFTGVDVRQISGTENREAATAKMAVWVAVAALAVTVILSLLTTVHLATGHA
jgi:hypothetical protein